MMQPALHPTPHGRDVLREQVRFVGLSLRRDALIAAVVLAIVTLVIGIRIVLGGTGIHLDADASAPIGFFSFLFPFAVWRGERRFGAAFLWTLPVDRRRLAFAKVFAGWVWLMAALAIFVSWLSALALFSAATGVRTATLFPFAGATAIYLLGGALVLGLRHPLRWLLGAASVFVLLLILSETAGRTESGELRIVAWSGLLRSAVYGPYGLDALPRQRTVRPPSKRCSIRPICGASGRRRCPAFPAACASASASLRR